MPCRQMLKNMRYAFAYGAHAWFMPVNRLQFKGSQ